MIVNCTQGVACNHLSREQIPSGIQPCRLLDNSLKSFSLFNVFIFRIVLYKSCFGDGGLKFCAPIISRFEPGANGAPPVVFFPLSDPGERLTQCSTSLQALLAIPRNSLTPLAKLLSNFEAGEAIIQLVSVLGCVWLQVAVFSSYVTVFL